MKEYPNILLNDFIPYYSPCLHLHVHALCGLAKPRVRVISYALLKFPVKEPKY
jgi:hypothetical protein